MANSITIQPEIIPTASNNEGANETAGNDAKVGANETFTFDWFVSEARWWFGLSMVKDAKDYYPAFLASYRPTLNRVGINETALINALILK